MMTITSDAYVIQRGPSATNEIKPPAPNRVKRNVCQKVAEYFLLSVVENSEFPVLSMFPPVILFRKGIE